VIGWDLVKAALTHGNLCIQLKRSRAPPSHGMSSFQGTKERHGRESELGIAALANRTRFGDSMVGRWGKVKGLIGWHAIHLFCFSTRCAKYHQFRNAPCLGSPYPPDSARMQPICADRRAIEVDADVVGESDQDPTYDMADEGSA